MTLKCCWFDTGTPIRESRVLSSKGLGLPLLLGRALDFVSPEPPGPFDGPHHVIDNDRPAHICCGRVFFPHH